jgi:cyclophilin family peptidyl-prolyl cis-trans isomerase
VLVPWILCWLLCSSASGAVGAPRSADPSQPTLDAGIRCDHSIIQAGQPVWIEFVLRNLSDEPLTVSVADIPPGDEGPSAMGLPLEHVFSGGPDGAILVNLENDANAYRVRTPLPPKTSKPLMIVPHGTVGTRIDLARYCEALHQPGKYVLQWRPYRGTLESSKLQIIVAPLRQAVITTDFGKMTVRFFQDEAPRTVENFVELCEKQFYDGLKFHRVSRGALIQGGCPRGDGTGVADSKRVKAEFSSLPLEEGSVVMATTRNDPDSASCQFYICLGRLRNLDGKQSVFGRLVGNESFETLRQIGAVTVGDQDRPLKPVYIRSISLENIPSQERPRIGGTGAATAPGARSSGNDGRAPAPLTAIRSAYEGEGRNAATKPAVTTMPTKVVGPAGGGAP